MMLLAVAACSPEETEAPPVEDGGLKIEQLYYSGSPPAGGADHYFSDQFVQLVNTASTAVDASGVMIGDAFGAAGAINPGMEPDSFAHRSEVVILSNLWRIPDGVWVEPGESVVIAHDGTNHRPFSTLDLSAAQFETYVESSGGDTDHPTVPNMERVHYTAGYDWLITVFGPSIVVVAADAEVVERDGPFAPLVRVDVEDVLDGIDTVMDADSGDFKRLPDGVDAGFAWVSGTYTGEALRRIKTADGWQDSDNSAEDFELVAPSPYVAAVESQIGGGEPSIELGLGTTAFAESSEAVLVEGSQGGWHIDVAVRIGGFDLEGVVLTYSATDAEGQPVAFETTALLHPASVASEGDGAVRYGDRVVFDVANGASLVGTEVTVRVEASLPTPIHDTVTWTIVD